MVINATRMSCRERTSRIIKEIQICVLYYSVVYVYHNCFGRRGVEKSHLSFSKVIQRRDAIIRHRKIDYEKYTTPPLYSHRALLRSSWCGGAA